MIQKLVPRSTRPKKATKWFKRWASLGNWLFIWEKKYAHHWNQDEKLYLLKPLLEKLGSLYWTSFKEQNWLSQPSVQASLVSDAVCFSKVFIKSKQMIFTFWCCRQENAMHSGLLSAYFVSQKKKKHCVFGVFVRKLSSWNFASSENILTKRSPSLVCMLRPTSSRKTLLALRDYIASDNHRSGSHKCAFKV